jgi:hypothetical protein
MTLIHNIFASILIAITALTTVSAAETIYKCGTSYSQTPCAYGKILSIEDARDTQQKKVADTNTRRDAKLANDMERERLAQERAVGPVSTQHETHSKTSGGSVIAVVSAPAPTTITPKRIKSKSYKPSGFVAVVPDSDSAPAKSKRPPKKASATAP